MADSLVGVVGASCVEGYGTELLFSEDHGEITDRLRFSSVELVLGSALEKQVALEMGVPFLELSFPLADRVVLNRCTVGYRGATTLLEDLGSALLAASGHRIQDAS